MVIVIVIILAGIYLLFSGVKEKIGNGCLTAIIVTIIVFLFIIVKSIGAFIN